MHENLRTVISYKAEVLHIHILQALKIACVIKRHSWWTLNFNLTECKSNVYLRCSDFSEGHLVLLWLNIGSLVAAAKNKLAYMFQTHFSNKLAYMFQTHFSNTFGYRYVACVNNAIGNQGVVWLVLWQPWLLCLALTTALQSALLWSLFGIRIAYSYAHVLNPQQNCF